MTKKKGSADDFSSILGDINPEAIKPQEPSIPERGVGEGVQALKKPKSTANDTQTTFYYPKSWKRRLKEQALHEDTTVNALVLEGVRLVFEKRGISLN